MIGSPRRRARASSRVFGALAALLLLAGQTALALHHHVRRAAGAGVSLTQQDESAADANCGLCSLSAQSRAAKASAPALALFSTFVAPVPPAAPAVFGGIPSPRASSRAPPAP